MVLLSPKLVVPILGHFILYINAWDKNNDPDFSLCAFLCCKTCEPLKACHWLSYDSSLATNEGGANSFQVPSVIYGIYASVLSLIFTSLNTVCNMFPVCAHKGAFPVTCPLNLSMSLSIG